MWISTRSKSVSRKESWVTVPSPGTFHIVKLSVCKSCCCDLLYIQFFASVYVCRCPHRCMLTWRLEVEFRRLSLSLFIPRPLLSFFFLLQNFYLYYPNLKVARFIGLTDSRASGILPSQSPIGGTKTKQSMLGFLCECRESELRSSHLYSKHFTDWAVFLAPCNGHFSIWGKPLICKTQVLQQDVQYRVIATSWWSMDAWYFKLRFHRMPSQWMSFSHWTKLVPLGIGKWPN